MFGLERRMEVIKPLTKKLFNICIKIPFGFVQISLIIFEEEVQQVTWKLQTPVAAFREETSARNVVIVSKF